MGVSRVWSRLSWRRRAALCAAAAAWCAVAVRAPASPLDARVTFPRTQPAALAHLLADFSTHPHTGSWYVEEERGNYTEWRYRVSFECGARCSGEARVQHAAGAGAHALGTPRHGRLSDHRVSVQLTLCTWLPLLPWPQICDEMELEWAVSPREAGPGCVLRERARARCAAGRVLAGACARDLRDYRDAHRARLRDALDETSA